MTVLAIPNVSEGRRPEVVERLVHAASIGGGRVLDRHVDSVHNRTVLTVVGELPTAMSRLAGAAVDLLDLTAHEGVHPRLGVLDVCPIVPHRGSLADAVEVARQTGRHIADEVGLPVFFYGEAATREETRTLTGLRKGGVTALRRRMEEGLLPDLGPAVVDPRSGVVCVGARGPLIAFNVWLRTSIENARSIAVGLRDDLGASGVRALGLAMGGSLVQVSMNLEDPLSVGIDDAFEAVAARAREVGAAITATEIVGLPEERFLPDPQKQAARLLLTPGRSFESALQS